MDHLVQQTEITAATTKKYFKRPKLPSELEQISYLKSALFVLCSLLLYVVPGYLAYQTWVSLMPVYIKIPVMCILLVLAQQGLHLIAWVGHEGFHSNLHRNKYISAYIGIALTSLIISLMQLGISISHWNHHAFTNQKNDPDVQIFSRFKTVWSRMFLIRPYANKIYFRNTILMALGKDLPYRKALPFTKSELQKMAVINLICSFMCTSAYVFITVINPAAGVICIIIPHILSIMYTSLRPYLEHADTGIETLTNSRTRSNLFFTLFYFGNNYHLEHHLYPRVPCYNLPALHRYLQKNGYYNHPDLHIVEGVLEAYSYASGNHCYPEGATDSATPDFL